MPRALAFLGCTALAAVLAAAENPEVARLAQQGHWVAQYWDAHKKLLGQPAPALELTDWLNGAVDRASWRGKLVVVDFWATWCGPCKAAIPHNNEIARKYRDKGVLFVGACGSGRGGGQEKMAEVAQQHKLAYSTAKVAEASTKAWAVFHWPTYAIVDRQGNLRALGIKPEAVEPILDALLKE